MIAAAVTLATLPASLGAQAVLGFGDDATTARGGEVRFGFVNSWTRDQRTFTDPSGSTIATLSQIRRTPVSLELGILDHWSITATVPSVGTQVTATYFPPTASAIHADSISTFPMSALGDVELSTKFEWLRTLDDSERYHPRGVHVRSALTGLVRLGTGQPAHSYAQFGIGTGDAQRDLEIGSVWDFILGSHVWTSVSGRWGHQAADARIVHAAPVDDPFFANAGPVFANRQLGNYYELDATPRLALGEYFSIGAEYQYQHKAADVFTGTNDVTTPSGAVVHVDASVLDANSELTEHRVGFGVVYSSVAAHAEGRGKLPFEVSFQHFKTVRISGGRVKPSTYAVSARVYLSAWGTH